MIVPPMTPQRIVSTMSYLRLSPEADLTGERAADLDVGDADAGTMILRPLASVSASTPSEPTASATIFSMSRPTRRCPRPARAGACRMPILTSTEVPFWSVVSVLAGGLVGGYWLGSSDSGYRRCLATPSLPPGRLRPCA